MDLKKTEDRASDSGNASDKGGPSNNKPPKNFLTYIMIVFVVPVMALWEAAKGLHKAVYEQRWTGPLRALIGVVAGVGAGIGTGYFEGWQNGWSWYAWLPAALAAAVATYAYLFPLAYLAVLRPLRIASKELWEAVPERNQWFTEFLKGAAKLGALGGSAWFAWTQAVSAHANLVANGWGFFAGPGAFAWFVIVGCVAAAFAWSIFATTIYGVCVGTGLLVAYGLMGPTSSLLSGFGLTTQAWTFTAAAVEFLLWIGFVFPLLHVVASHGLRFVKDLALKVYKAAYEKTVGQYEGVFTQLVNIWTAYHLATLSLTLFAALGLTLAGWVAWVVPAMVALLSYVLVGQLFRAVGNRGLGIVAAAHALRWTVVPMLASGFALGWVIGGGVLAMALTFYLVYPLAYVLVRLVGQFVLNNNVAGLLVTAHDKACDAAEQLVREVAEARTTTYGDDSWFAKMFLHLANVTLLLPVWYYMSGFLAAVGTSGWAAYAFTALALVLSYLLIGRLLLAARNFLVGGVVALVGAIVAGTLAYAHTTWGLWVGIPAGLVGGFLVAGWLFPVAYVFARFVVNLVDGFVPLFSKVVEPVVRGVHEFCWKQAAGLWEQFKSTYRMVKEAIKPVWNSIGEAWSSAWQSVKDTWESIKRGRS